MKRHLRLSEIQHEETQKQIDGQYSASKKYQYELPTTGLFQQRLKIFTGITTLDFGNLFRCSCCNQLTASTTTFRPYINQIICHFDHIQIVLDHDNRVTLLNQFIQDIK